MDEGDMYPICDQCHHAMSMHIGPVDMGGGNVEPLGCTHSVAGPDEICMCTNYDKDGEY
jgi:hypothetical protein